MDARPKNTKRKRKLDNLPRKKKRTNSDSDGPAREPCNHGERSHDVRNGSGLKQLISANEEEDESTKGQSLRYDEDERILEEALSEGYHSASMNDVNDESWNNDFEVDSLNDETQQMKDEQKVREEEEDSDEGQVLKLSTTRHLPQAEEDSSSEDEALKMAPRQPQPPTQPNPSPRIHASPLKKPSARTVPQPPPSWKRKQPAVPARVPTLGPKALNKTRPTVTTNQVKDSSFVAQSSSRNLQPRPPLFELESDSVRSPRPEWHRKPQSRPTTKHLRKERDVISIHLDECDSEVILSPRAQQRLAIFDAEVMRKKTQVVEKKRVKGVNGKGEVPALKCSSSSGHSRGASPTMRHPPRFDPQSFNMDVVPETELKNSQNGKLPPPSAAIKSSGKRNNVSPIASPIPGPSVLKPLQGLPRLSSSTIHPHPAPNLSLHDTFVETSSSLKPSPCIRAIEQFESPENEHAIIPKSGAESGRLTTKKISLQEVFARAESRRRSERHANQFDV